MQSIAAFFKRYPVLTYYVLTFVISWSAIAWVIVTGGIPATKEGMNAVLPVAIVAMLLGPSAAGLLMTGVVDGRAGFRALGARLGKWRVGVRWYVIAIFLIPLVLLLGFMVLAQFSLVYLPGIFTAGDKSSRLTMGIMSGLAVGILEELGWTGFANPKLRLRYSILFTGIIMGVLWGAWHIAGHVVLASGAYSAPLSPTVYIVTRGLGFLIGQLVAIRVLIVWVHDRTGSLLLAMLMHWTYTASTMILEPTGISGVPLMIYDVVAALTMWIVVAVVALISRGTLEARRPHEDAHPGAAPTYPRTV